ncbi:MAG: LytTR family DNA-binding domain-containing protein [Spirochaetes bacterium]|nr:LytTR family DNA-binding domain-containing protein [Spirochaetota bacterium]
MRILIIEDEYPTAEDIRDRLLEILGRDITTIHIETTIQGALVYLKEKSVDVVLLDLNLNSQDGFEILQKFVKKTFHTIIISANDTRAIEAFEYGVFDFIAKPYTTERLKTSFERLRKNVGNKSLLQYISVHKGTNVKLLPLQDVIFFKAVGMYVEIHLTNSKVEFYDQPLKILQELLPSRFLRVHRSYIVDTERIDRLVVKGGGRYSIVLLGKYIIPVSRKKIGVVRNIVNGILMKK